MSFIIIYFPETDTTPPGPRNSSSIAERLFAHRFQFYKMYSFTRNTYTVITVSDQNMCYDIITQVQ